MQRSSFVAGLIAGGTLALGVVVAVPGIVPRDENPAQHVERTLPPIVIHTVARDAPAKPPEIPPAAAKERKPTDEEEFKQEAEALAVMMHAARLRSNENAAIATLRNIISAQAQFQTTAIADENRNGVGEYGAFGELSAAKPVREDRVMNPPVLSKTFRKVENGRVKRGGYYFKIFLPSANGDGLAEYRDGGFLAHVLDPNAAETTWCAYAWPVEHGVTGERCFFVNQAGDIYANSDRKYSGESEPPSYAAFDPSGVGILGKVAPEGVGGDRGTWKQAG